jgi:ketosteroid isomerase-like protein
VEWRGPGTPCDLVGMGRKSHATRTHRKPHEEAAKDGREVLQMLLESAQAAGQAIHALRAHATTTP